MLGMFFRHSVHRVSKNSQNCFCHSFVKFPAAYIISGTKVAKTAVMTSALCG